MIAYHRDGYPFYRHFLPSQMPVCHFRAIATQGMGVSARVACGYSVLFDPQRLSAACSFELNLNLNYINIMTSVYIGL
jgi:hypothetical protein